MLAAFDTEGHGVSDEGRSMYRSPRALDNLGCGNIRDTRRSAQIVGIWQCSCPFRRIRRHTGCRRVGVSMAEPSRTDWT